MKKKIGVLLAGSGVYDGSEIHEAVFALLAIDEAGAEAVCMAPNIAQAHVVNHLTGEEMPESRNVLTEAARIARGNIRDLATVQAGDIDALVIPGGFGAAKNLSRWAFDGPAGAIQPEVQRIIRQLHQAGKPICGLCIAPTAIAKAFEGTSVHATLTVGTTAAASPYDIAATSAALESTGAQATMCSITEIAVDKANKIVTAPCYMMEASISQIRANAAQAIQATLALL